MYHFSQEYIGILYLLGIVIGRSSVAVALAIDGRVTATTDGIHFPLREIVVNNVDIAPPAPWHPLHQLLPEVIERNRYLHPRVRQVVVAVPKQHHLVVM